jgi:hypothetical protein
MAGETKTLAKFAADLRYEDIPTPAIVITRPAPKIVIEA